MVSASVALKGRFVRNVVFDGYTLWVWEETLWPKTNTSDLVTIQTFVNLGGSLAAPRWKKSVIYSVLCVATSCSARGQNGAKNITNMHLPKPFSVHLSNNAAPLSAASSS
eukprot:3602982-Amphidinium_carterae.1